MPDPELASSWEHCRDITLTADGNGFDNILLPSGYTLGIDSTAFAAGIAPLVERIRLLLAVRMGEMWLPQLARQLATIDQMLDGRLTINIISSDIPGETLESEPRYRRTLEWMQVLRQLLDGESIDFHGESALRAGADDDGYAEANLWTGVGRARSGAGAAIVGDPDQAKLDAYRDVGVEAFILSGYPHIAECDLFAERVLPQLDHGPIF